MENLKTAECRACGMRGHHKGYCWINAMMCAHEKSYAGKILYEMFKKSYADKQKEIEREIEREAKENIRKLVERNARAEKLKFEAEKDRIRQEKAARAQANQ